MEFLQNGLCLCCMWSGSQICQNKTLESSFGLFVKNFSDWTCTVYHAHWQAPDRDLKVSSAWKKQCILNYRSYSLRIFTSPTVVVHYDSESALWPDTMICKKYRKSTDFCLITTMIWSIRCILVNAILITISLL